jgi:amino acid transporter
VADNAGGAAWIYLAWLIGGAVSILGALCYGELTTAFAHPGGDYHFLRLSFGRGVAFLFAWCRFTIINTGQIALLAFVLGAYLNKIAPLGDMGEGIYATIAVGTLTLFNLRKPRAADKSDFGLTFLEVGGVLLLVVAAIWIVLQGRAVDAPIVTAAPTIPAFGQALVFVMLAYGGWNEVATFAAETRDEKHGMVRALVMSVVMITALFLAVNWALLTGLGVAGLAKSEAPAADLTQAAYGAAAGPITALAVALAVLTSINATILTGGRITYAWAQDWPALNGIAAWDAKRGAPAAAILAQSAMALALVAWGAWSREGFSTMVDFTSPIYWLFMALSALALLILRRRHPDAQRPFKTPLYPLTPLLFLAASLGMLWSGLLFVGGANMAMSAGRAASLVLLALGVAMMMVLQRGTKRA